MLGVSRLSERDVDGAISEAAGRLAQEHWTLLYLGIFGLILSWLYWKNDKTAYWLSTLFIIILSKLNIILQRAVQPMRCDDALNLSLIHI